MWTCCRGPPSGSGCWQLLVWTPGQSPSTRSSSEHIQSEAEVGRVREGGGGRVREGGREREGEREGGREGERGRGGEGREGGREGGME